MLGDRQSELCVLPADDCGEGGGHGAVPVEGWVEISAVSGTSSLGLMMGGQPGAYAVHADGSGEGGGHGGHAVPGEGEVDTSVMSGTAKHRWWGTARTSFSACKGW